MLAFATKLFLGSIQYPCSSFSHKSLHNDSTIISKVIPWHLKTIIRTAYMFYKMKQNFITYLNYETHQRLIIQILGWKKNLDLCIFVSWFQKKLFIWFSISPRKLVSSKHLYIADYYDNIHTSPRIVKRKKHYCNNIKWHLADSILLLMYEQ